MQNVQPTVVEGEIVEAPVRSGIVPRVAVRIREATLADLPFIDGLQKQHSKELGFLPRMAIEGKVKAGHVLVAEGGGSEEWGAGQSRGAHSDLRPAPPTPLGYLIAADRYFRRDEVGYITQINVVPEFRRSLVAGALLQAQFDRSAYGCRLYSCWCAQDLKANAFWEAMGFVPIAFRTGSRTKGKGGGPRIHIFWQKRIRPDDVTTPWWYPSQTGGGELREDRLVFPMPPGVGWRDVLPVVLPEDDGQLRLLEEPKKRRPKTKLEKRVTKRIVKKPRGPMMPGGLWFADDLIEVEEEVVEMVRVPVEPEAIEAKKEKPTLDPRLTAMARELRDRWTERVDLIAEPEAKHDVRRLVADEDAPNRLDAPITRTTPRLAA